MMDSFSVTANDLTALLTRLELDAAVQEKAAELGQTLELMGEAEGLEISTELTSSGKLKVNTTHGERALVESLLDELSQEENLDD